MGAVVRTVSWGTLDNVDRVAALRPEELDRRYLRSGTPVILTGLFDGAPVAALADRRRARAALADMAITVTANTWEDLLRGTERQVQRRTSFGRFLDQLVDEANQVDYCIEHDTPDELLAYVPVPPYVADDSTDSWESYLFLAGAGNTVHLHYDFDLRHVLMYQVFGRKRYVVIDPTESRKLAPGSRPHVRRTSALFLEHFSDADLTAFLRYANAWDCILEPGETLLIPAACWHYVEYLDTAMSVNFCLERNHHLRTLAEIFPDSNVEMMALATRFRNPDALGPAELDAFAAVQAADQRWYPDRTARLAALDALSVDLCERLGLTVGGLQYHAADIERRRRVLARR